MLDIDAKGTPEDRKDLVLLYTFDETNSENKILNQIHKNNLNHPTHLLFQGKRANAELSNGAITFKKNSILTAIDNAFVARELGATYRGETITLDRKKAVAQKVVPETVYLKSQGEMKISSLCESDEEMTWQTFFKPERINVSAKRAHLAFLGATNTGKNDFSLKEIYGLYTTQGSLADKFFSNSKNDLDYTGINESVQSMNKGGKLSSYHLLHNPSGKEGWLSFERATPSFKFDNENNSRLLIGSGPFLYKEGSSNILNNINAENDNAKLILKIRNSATGFKGVIYQLALYCRSADQAEILGGDFNDTTKIKVTPELNSEPTQSEKLAVRLLSLISKKKIPIDADIVKEAAVYISRGNYEKAAQIGVNLPDFYNNTVKEMGLKMSNREETVDVPLNDLAATLIGVVRDDINAKELLTGNFYYRADPYAGVASDELKHMVTSNAHYEVLTKRGLDLKNALIKTSPQKIMGTASSLVDHPDPAGVLTSRAFLSAHAVAGTNRRQVEYAFKQFMCVNLSDIADTEASDLRVGRDIDRFPAGSHKKYQTSCKGCHTVMDGFRGAFAKTDFDEKSLFIKYGDYFSMNTKRVANKTHTYPADISYKVNHNEFSYPKGYVTTDDSFYNFANRGANKILFGWRSSVNKGFGMGQFGKMLSESERFSKCMVKRVFEAICPVNINESTLAKMQLYVWDFEKNNYDLKKLFINAAISPLCLGGN